MSGTPRNTERRAARGYTIAEIITALTVIMVAGTMFIALLSSSRRASRRTAETRLAATIAQAVYERFRALPPARPKPLRRGEGPAGELAPGPVEAPAPAVADGLMQGLAEAELTATVSPWEGAEGVRHVRVALRWRSPDGEEREVAREGLASDARAR